MHSLAEMIATLVGGTTDTGYLLIGLLLGFFLGLAVGRRKSPHSTALHGSVKSSASTGRAARTLDQTLSSSQHGYGANNHHNLPPDVLAEVRSLVGSGNKIEAIKVVRDATGLGLAEAKSLVESL